MSLTNVDFMSSPDNDKAIEAAKKWMDRNPNFEPKFTRVANVVLNHDAQTRNMTNEVFAEAGITEPHFMFSMAQYAYEVMNYYSTRQERNCDIRPYIGNGEIMSTDNHRVLEAAKQWMSDNPDFMPKFSLEGGKIVLHDPDTIKMTQESMKKAKVKDRYPFSIAIFAYSVSQHWLNSTVLTSAIKCDE